MIQKIKQKLKRYWRWFLITICGVGIVFAAPTAPDKISEHLKLKAPEERILNVVYSGNKATSTVVYAIKSVEKSAKFANETKRTNNTVTQKIDHNSYVVTSFLGQKFYRKSKNDDWYDVTYATTTKEAYEKQTKKIIPIAKAADTGFKNPAATGDDYNQWTNPTYAYTSDNNYASQSGSTQLQDYYNFTFGVSSGATIDGIETTWEGEQAGPYTGNMMDVDISWNGGTTYTSAKTIVDNSGSGDYTATLGGSSDTWGRSWSDTEFSNTNFRIRGKNIHASGPWVVDHIQVKVYYTEAAAGTNMQINISDAWKDVELMKINIGDVWKDVEGVQINIGDSWETVY